MAEKHDFELLDWRPLEDGEKLHGTAAELEEHLADWGAAEADIGGFLIADTSSDIAFYPKDESLEALAHENGHDAKGKEDEDVKRRRCCGYARIPCCRRRILVRICVPRRCVRYVLRYRCRVGKRVCFHRIYVHCR